MGSANFSNRARDRNVEVGALIRDLIGDFVEHYNNRRLHSAIGYVAPADKLAGREREIWASTVAPAAALDRAARPQALDILPGPPFHATWADIARPSLFAARGDRSSRQGLDPAFSRHGSRQFLVLTPAHPTCESVLVPTFSTTHPSDPHGFCNELRSLPAPLLASTMRTCMLMAHSMNDEPEQLSFGRFLHDLRRALDMDIDELSQRATLSTDVLRAMEGEAVQPTANDLLALARGFGMSTGTMLRLWRGPGLVTSA